MSYHCKLWLVYTFVQKKKKSGKKSGKKGKKKKKEKDLTSDRLVQHLNSHYFSINFVLFLREGIWCLVKRYFVTDISTLWGRGLIPSWLGWGGGSFSSAVSLPKYLLWDFILSCSSHLFTQMLHRIIPFKEGIFPFKEKLSFFEERIFSFFDWYSIIQWYNKNKNNNNTGHLWLHHFVIF